MTTEFTNSNLEVLYSTEQINRRVVELGQEIAADYAEKDLVVVGVLKGSCVFMADLIRAIDLPLAIDLWRSRPTKTARNQPAMSRF